MTEERAAALKMYMVISKVKIRRLKKRCFFLTLLLIASIAFNLAYIFTHIGGNECNTIDERQETALHDR